MSFSKTKTALTGALTLALCVLADNKPAQAVVIDAFQTLQTRIEADGSGTTVSSYSTGAGILGGERDVSISVVKDTNSVGLASFGIGGGLLRFSNDLDVASTATVTWDGIDSGSSSNAFGLGGFDLTAGGAATGINFAAFSDHDADLTLNFYDSASNYSSIKFTIAGSNDDDMRNYRAEFSDLVASGAGVDLTSVNAISMMINAQALANVDLKIGALTAVPAPGGMALAGLMMLALWASRRRTYLASRGRVAIA